MKKAINSIGLFLASLIPLHAASTTIREEVQRYLGYENLPMRYFTLIYDALLGTNIALDSFDVGFIYLTVLPLLFLYHRPKSWWWLFPMGFLYLLISIPYGYAALANLSLQEALSQKEALWGILSWQKIILHLDSWIIENIDLIKGITYIILFVSFILLLRLIQKGKSKLNIVLTLFLILLFFWVILSAGVPWYGIMLIPLGLLLLGIGHDTLDNRIKKSSFYNIGIGALVGFQMFLWVTFRLSGYYATPKLNGYMAEAASIQYQSGAIEEKDYQELLTKVPQELINFINQDTRHLVYRNGTNLQYFISNNKKRVFEDNQLGNFELLSSVFKDKIDIARAMELSGIKFLIIDLNMANIDKTPEKSLFKKYEKLIKFLYQNEKLKLLYTDRIVQDKGTGERQQRVFDNGNLILQPGSLAVYMII